MDAQCMSNIKRDFIASNLRSQVGRLTNILGSIEQDSIDCDYMHDLLKEIESNLRQIRKLCADN